MASGPSAVAQTPPGMNPVPQDIIDKGTPIILTSPTPTPTRPPNKRTRYDEHIEPIARPDLPQAGRTHKATHTPLGLDASIHARPTNTATGSLGQVLGEHNRRLSAKRKVLNLIASSHDNITASCDQELKGPAEEIISLFTKFLEATILKPNTNPNTWIPAPDVRSWAQMASNTATPAPHAHKPQTARNQPTENKKSEDLRIFVRIPEEHREETKKHTGFTLRHTICKQLQIPADAEMLINPPDQRVDQYIDIKAMTKPKTPWDLALQEFEKNKEALTPLSETSEALGSALDEKFPGTCQWLFEDTRYVEWEASQTSSMLCITGQEGEESGKHTGTPPRGWQVNFVSVSDRGDPARSDQLWLKILR